MNQVLETDLHNCVDALEDYITRAENHLIETQAGDAQWNVIQSYKDTLKNLNYLISIYG